MIAAVILAAGQGTRFGRHGMKQFLLVNRKPLLIHTLSKFARIRLIDRIVIVIPVNKNRIVRAMLRKYCPEMRCELVIGGRTRQESVYNALQYLSIKRPQIVIIHEAVRPLVTREVILNSVNSAKRYGAADVVVPATDTLVKAEKGFITLIPLRKGFYYGQTPQAFRWDVIWKAHQLAKKENYSNVTDDAKLVIRAGFRVAIIKGDYSNIKLTHEIDRDIIKALM